MKKLAAVLMLTTFAGALVGCANQVIPSQKDPAGVDQASHRITQVDLQAAIRAQNERELAARAARRGTNP